MSTQFEMHAPGSAHLSSPTDAHNLVERYFSTPGVHPYDEIAWDTRDAVIMGEGGKVVFEQAGVEVPAGWTQLATNVVVSKYFHGAQDTPERETSVRQLIDRVVKTIARWGRDGRYFSTAEEATLFEHEVTALCVQQRMAFNSPVWFNVGVQPKPQCSACFINSVQDTMDDILRLAHTEGMLFKWGSGTGTNLSVLRSSIESLAGGGTASGPVSFMRGFDAFAGVIKSGGKTRRAAKMVILNIDHPDISEFIACKATEERKAWALIDAGYDGAVDGAAYTSVFFQNSNNSVRVTDEYMDALVRDAEWHTRAVTTGEVLDTRQARDLWRQIAEAAHLCGDPGLQFHTTVNEWHMCPNTAPINASNPCSEYMFLDDSACNLASLNLLTFRNADGTFAVEAFCRAVHLTILAQEIIIDNASYPTEKIQANSHRFRPLGLGYANLGAFLMAKGLPYDSDAGRATAAALTALMHGQANLTSADIAARVGAFAGYEENREPAQRVLHQHARALADVHSRFAPAEVVQAAELVWAQTLKAAEEHGLRNAQVTVIAPTGTIGFMMDCDTTGIEPDIALVKYKKLVGGGMLKIVNQTVPLALAELGYTADQIDSITSYIDEHDTIEGAPDLNPDHLPVFDCAFKPLNGTRSIHHMGHVKMMGAVQPFVSGAISKTVNMPTDATVDDIMGVYEAGWRLGLKAIAIYRDGCKRTQPLNTGLEAPAGAASDSLAAEADAWKPRRRRLPDEREARTHKFSVGGHEGYISVGLFEDRRPGEIFITMAKEGSVISGLMDAFATSISISLQYGVPLEVLVKKFSHMRFEPSGFTGSKEIPMAKSIMDYLFRWLELRYLKTDAPPAGPPPTIDPAIMDGHGNGNGNGHAEDGTAPQQFASTTSAVVAHVMAQGANTVEEIERAVFQAQADAPPCSECGSALVRNGSCYKCLNCGAQYGCS